MSDIREKLQNKIDGVSNTTNVTSNKTNIVTEANDIRSKLQNKIDNTSVSINTTTQKNDGNFFQKAGSTAGDFATNIGKGFLNTLEGVVDLGRYGIAGIADFFGADEYANDVRERAKQDTTSQILKPAEDLYNQHSVLKEGGIIEGVAQGIGNVGAMVGGGALLPKGMQTIGTKNFKLPTPSIISGMGSGMSEAYNNGATDGEAVLYGLGSGMMEGFSESLFGGLGSKYSKIFGGGALDDVAIKALSNKIKNKTLKILAESGLKALGEGTEEVISGYGSAIIKKLTYLSDEDFKKIVKDEKLLEQFIMGTLTSSVMQTSGTINSIKTGNDYITNENVQSNETNTQNNLNTLQADATNKYTYLPTNNQKSNNLRQSATQYFSNSQETINMVDTIDKVIRDKGYNVLFDNTIVNPQGESVNAQIKALDNGEIEIRINPNSQRAGEFLLTHEITHAIETDSMKQLVMDYASKNAGFNEALESLKQTYGTTEVTDEVLADISGQLFGNQEFINNLSMEQPNIFRRIYNKIVELANKITGNSKESLFIKDLKNKWETAYRNTTTEQAISNLNNSTKESIVTDNNKSWVKADRKVIKGTNPDLWTMQVENYINDKLRNNEDVVVYGVDGTPLTITSDTAGKAKFRNTIQQADGTFREMTNEEYIAKLRAESHIDELAQVSKTGNKIVADTKNHPFAKDGFNYRTAYFEDLDGKYYKVTLSIGINGEINTIYNVGRMSETTQKKGSKQLEAQRPSNKNVANVSSIANNIPQSNNIVKSGTVPKYSMQESTKNTQELDNSSFFNTEHSLQEELENNLAKRMEILKIDTKTLINDFNDYLEYELNKDKMQVTEADINAFIETYNDMDAPDNNPNDTFMTQEELDRAKNIIKNYLKENNVEILSNETFSTDNQGRTLTKEQQEYFKDSKVRDENGNLLTVYHGTNSEFTIFDLNKSGESNKTAKVGFWFTESQQGAENFANDLWYGDKTPNAMSVYLNITNPKIYETYDSSTEVDKIQNELDETRKEKNRIASDFAYNNFSINNVIQMSKLYGKSLREFAENEGYRTEERIKKYIDDVEKYQELNNKAQELEKIRENIGFDDSYEQFRTDIYAIAGQSANDANLGGIGMMLNNETETIAKFRQKLIDEGYDGIIIKNTRYDSSTLGEGNNNNQYVAFYSSQIKNVDNTNPTTDPDIRYSQQDNTWQEHLEKNYKATGTRTDMPRLSLPKASKIQNVDKVENAPKLPKAKRNIPQDPTKESSYDNDTKKTRKQVSFELLNEMGISEQDIAKGNDISSIDLSRTDPIRVNEKVFGSKIGQKINDATINKTKHNEAERTRWLNKERDEIKSLGIKAQSKESAAVQKYGEKQYITRNNEVIPYGDAQLAKDFPNVETQNKIKKAAKLIRNKYDNYIEQINKVLVEMGYNPIKKRPDYMRHFQALNDVFSRFGTPLNAESMQNDSLPTDINGLTDQFKPGKQYFANAMQRMGLKTEYDAITGIDGYLDGASNLIFHTEDIQRYRTLSKLIRETYGSKNGYEDFANMTAKEQEQRIEDIQSNKLAKYAAWLDEQANALAGKKGKIDRGAEELFGRKVYTVLQTAKKQVGSNMTGYNVRSALTNFASAIQGASKTNKLAFLKGTMSTINNIIHNDGLIDKSDFLTSRFGSDSLSSKLWQKMSNAGQIFMKGSDYFTANQVWRSKYFENLSKGMNESEAIRKADDFASRVMGDRSKGSTATIFNSNTLGFLTQFQLEVNNQWSSLIHDNKMDVQRGNKVGASVVFQLGQLFAMSYLFNGMMKSLTGSGVMIDPIELLKKIFKPDDEEKSLEERTTEVLGEVVNNVPFASIFTGGRIPISEAFDGVATGFKFATGQTDEYGNKYTLSDVKNDMIESAFYWLLPTGYGQAKKTIKGASMYSGKLPTAGSYTDSGNLRFTSDESVGGKTKALLFGQYSSKEAQDYIDSGFKTISKNHIQEMKELGMTSTEYRNYRNGLAKAGTKNSEKLDYINNLDVSVEQKNIMANNVVDSKKYTVDMKDYSDYGSYEAMKYAMENPTNYSIITSIAEYDKYLSYKEQVSQIKDKYSNPAQRKQMVFEYINSLPYNKAQKIILFKMLGNYGISDYKNDVYNYINELKISKKEKEQMWQQIYGK